MCFDRCFPCWGRVSFIPRHLLRFKGPFAADKVDAEGEGWALAAGEVAEACLSKSARAFRGVDFVDDGIGIMGVEDVDGFKVDGPMVPRAGSYSSRARLRL